MRGPRVILDLSQFVSWPATSGIQRVLRHVLEGLKLGPVDAYVGTLQNGNYDVVRVGAAADAIGEVFACAESLEGRRALARLRFDEAKLFTCEQGELDLLFDAYWLPEPTYSPDVLAVGQALRDRANIPVLLLAYDVLPVSAPWLFRGRHQMVTDPYFRFLASVENVACISAQVGRDIETRLRRRAITNATVLPLGADGLGPAYQSQPPSQPTFVSIGTIEPRKNVPMILDAMRRLWDAGGQHRLTLLGAAGWEDDDFIAELRGLAATDDRVMWFEDADDDLVRRTMERATALVFASEHEGFGLPPLEALSLGVPVITSARVPSLEGLAPEGQVRLPDMTVDALAVALADVGHPRVNQALRRQAEFLDLPTWREFYVAMNSWIDDTLRRAEPRPRSTVAAGSRKGKP